MHCVSMNLNCKVLTDKPAQLKEADPKGVSTPDVLGCASGRCILECALEHDLTRLQTLRAWPFCTC